MSYKTSILPSSLIYGGLHDLNQDDQATATIHMGQILHIYTDLIGNLAKELPKRMTTRTQMIEHQRISNEIYRLTRLNQTLRDAIQIVNNPSHP